MNLLKVTILIRYSYAFDNILNFLVVWGKVISIFWFSFSRWYPLAIFVYGIFLLILLENILSIEKKFRYFIDLIEEGGVQFFVEIEEELGFLFDQEYTN